MWLVVSLSLHVELHKNGLTGAGLSAGVALPASRLTCIASQLHSNSSCCMQSSLPGHAKSDGTSQEAPKRLLSLFLTLPCYFGPGLVLFFPTLFVNSVAFRPAQPAPPSPPSSFALQASCPNRTIGACPQSACLAIPRGRTPPGLRIVSVTNILLSYGCETLLHGHRATLDSLFRRTT